MNECTSTNYSTSQRLGSVLARIAALEKNFPDDPLDRVRRYLRRQKVFNAVLIRVPSDYYSFDLYARASLISLGGGGIHVDACQLCKSIVFENTMWLPTAGLDVDVTNSRYYCVVVQYEAKFDAELLRDVVHQLRPPEMRLSRKKIHFQLAAEEISTQLTGFGHNAVSPVGMLCQCPATATKLGSSLPIVVCSRIVSESIKNGFSMIYVGGGCVDVKLGISICDLIGATNAIVGRVSVGRAVVRSSSNGGDDNYCDD